MAKRTIRQLATQNNWNVAELIQFLGASNGSEQIEENDPRLQRFLNRDNPQQEGGNLFTEVATEYQQHLDATALKIRLQGNQYLRDRLIQYTAMPTEVLQAGVENRDSQNFTAALETMWNSQAPLENLVALPGRNIAMLRGNTEPQSTLPPTTQPSPTLSSETQT